MKILNTALRRYIEPLLRRPYFWLGLSIFNFAVLLFFMFTYWDASKTLALAEIVKALSSITWPALILVAGWMFRDDVRLLVRQTQKFGPQGWERVPIQTDTRAADELMRVVDPLNRYPDYLTPVI